MEIQCDYHSGAEYVVVHETAIYCSWNWEGIEGLHIEYLHPYTDELVQYIIKDAKDREQELSKIIKNLFG